MNRISLTMGCKIEFTESVYTPYEEGKVSPFIGERTITGRIISEDYSKKSGYHFFTIHVYSCIGINAYLVENGSKIVRRGTVVYPKLQVISFPDNYQQLLDEKEKRKALIVSVTERKVL